MAAVALSQMLVKVLTGVHMGSERMHTLTNQVAAGLTVLDVAPSRQEIERRIASVAAGKWRRAQLTSAQLSTYYVGYCEISDLAADLRAAHPGLTDQQLHDRMLAHGSPPVRLLRTLIAA